MKYTINLVREIRLAEIKEEAKRVRAFTFSAVCIGILALTFLYSGFKVFEMRNVLVYERDKLQKIETEYHKYKSTKMIVDKSDIELLDRLQNNRIFWTKKLAAMAKHLPANYWITKFLYNNGTYRVYGYGNISKEQEQLVVLNDYLNQLRSDSTYSDVFTSTSFISTKREDGKGRMKVSFEFLSVASKRYKQ